MEKINNLRTLKDIRIKLNNRFTPDVICLSLQEEAIKWIKSQELQCHEGDNHTKQWIKHFFNITDEDIQSPQTKPLNALRSDESKYVKSLRQDKTADTNHDEDLKEKKK